ncbi:MAG: hypothetical protein ACM3XO_10440 [Bacteroidota bacterium]
MDELLSLFLTLPHILRQCTGHREISARRGPDCPESMVASSSKPGYDARHEWYG